MEVSIVKQEIVNIALVRDQISNVDDISTFRDIVEKLLKDCRAVGFKNKFNKNEASLILEISKYFIEEDKIQGIQNISSEQQHHADESEDNYEQKFKSKKEIQGNSRKRRFDSRSNS